MNRYYVACELGVGTSRVMVGTLHQGHLTISELQRFPNLPVQENGAQVLNIQHLFNETVEGLRVAGSYEEPVDGISCSSWAGDYLLFESDGTLLGPAYYRCDPHALSQDKPVLPNIPPEVVYEETGTAPKLTSTLFQLLSENSRRLKRAGYLMPVADGFNYLLTGLPRVEASLACASQLYNPLTQAWSARLLNALRVSPKLLPPVVSAGTELGVVQPKIAGQSGLAEARVIVTCSHELSAALAGLPFGKDENWIFVRPGRSTLLGTQVPQPIVTDATRDRNFSNQALYGGSVCLYKQQIGLWILEECQRYWEGQGRPLETDLLCHLAGASTPFESLINPADPRFLTPGDMPLKIQAFCKETNQAVPRKPGPIFRCILESLAFLYRETLADLEELTGRQHTRIYLLDGSVNPLLNHFIANALQLPVVVVRPESSAIGNVVIQALTLGHISSVDQAREIIRRSFKTETIVPQSTVWNSAYERYATMQFVENAAEGGGGGGQTE